MFPFWASLALAVEVDRDTFYARMELRGSEKLPQGLLENVTVPVDLTAIAPNHPVRDPIFVDEDQETVLPHEVEVVGETTVYWVRVSELGINEPLWVYWDAQQPPVKPQEPLWPQALGVWHFTDGTSCSVCELPLQTQGDVGVPGIWASALDVNGVGGIELTGDIPDRLTLSAWVRVDLGAELHIAEGILSLGALVRVERCPGLDRQVRLVVDFDAFECLSVDWAQWNYYTLSMGPDGFLFTVNDQGYLIEKSSFAPNFITVAAMIGADVDELRVYSPERDPLLLHVDWRSGYEPLFVFDHFEGELPSTEIPDTDVVDSGTGEDSVGEWARARWSGGCQTGAGAGSTGALGLLALLCARRYRR